MSLNKNVRGQLLEMGVKIPNIIYNNDICKNTFKETNVCKN